MHFGRMRGEMRHITKTREGKEPGWTMSCIWTGCRFLISCRKSTAVSFQRCADDNLFRWNTVSGLSASQRPGCTFASSFGCRFQEIDILIRVKNRQPIWTKCLKRLGVADVFCNVGYWGYVKNPLPLTAVEKNANCINYLMESSCRKRPRAKKEEESTRKVVWTRKPVFVRILGAVVLECNRENNTSE